MGNHTSSYVHADRKVPYRSETLEISKKEHKILEEWLKISVANSKKILQPKNYGTRQKIIFDTDIGTDIDDALALLMTLHLPATDVKILGITTVYGHTPLRAKVAQSIIDAYFEGKNNNNNNNEDSDNNENNKDKENERETIPVIAGESVPIGTHRDVWHTGTEGVGVMTFEEIVEMTKKPFDCSDHKAANFIIQQILANPGEVVVVCLGAMTNLAVAMKLNPKIIPLIKRVVYMGMGHRMEEKQSEQYVFKLPHEVHDHGFVYFHYPNHNISSDTMAAVIVFKSGVEVTVVNDTITNTLWFGMKPTRDDSKDPAVNPCAALMKATSPPECKVVGDLLTAWLDYRTNIFHRTMRGTCPHDAITVAEAIYPGRFGNYVRGKLMIHEWAGFSSFVLDPEGPHEIGISGNSEDFMNFLVPLLVPFWVPPPNTPLLHHDENRK